MLERKEQIEGEDHQIMNQEVEDETDVGLGFTVFKRSPVFPVRVGTLQRRKRESNRGKRRIARLDHW
jgi:hypothetical protein